MREGLLGLPKDTPVFFYTVAGSASEWSKGKNLYSGLPTGTDQGETLTKIEENVLEHIEADNQGSQKFTGMRKATLLYGAVSG